MSQYSRKHEQFTCERNLIRNCSLSYLRASSISRFLSLDTCLITSVWSKITDDQLALLLNFFGVADLLLAATLLAASLLPTALPVFWEWTFGATRCFCFCCCCCSSQSWLGRSPRKKLSRLDSLLSSINSLTISFSIDSLIVWFPNLASTSKFSLSSENPNSTSFFCFSSRFCRCTAVGIGTVMAHKASPTTAELQGAAWGCGSCGCRDCWDCCGVCGGGGCCGPEDSKGWSSCLVPIEIPDSSGW